MKWMSLALAAVLLAACAADSKKSAAPQPSPALPADVAQLAPTPAAAVPPTDATPPAERGLAGLEPSGEFRSPSRSEVAPKFPGRVAAVYVDEGARVTKGQPLFALETEYLKLDVARAQSEELRAMAALDEARREYERKKGLLANQSIPQATFDRAEAAFQQAQAARSAAATALTWAEQRLGDAVLRSPLSGVVAERRIDVGEHLGEAGVAMVIVQTAPLKLRFSVPERYLGALVPGRRVAARVDPYPGETFVGTVQTVGGVIDPATRTFFAEASFPNADGRLRPGLFARVRLEEGPDAETR